MRYWLGRIALTLGCLAAVLALLTWLLWMPSIQEPPYRFVRSWGELGDQPGQFNDPTGIEVSQEEVFVSDSRNARIQVFDFEGHFKRQFGSAGSGSGQLGRPMNLSIYDGELYVADYWNDRIQVYSLDGKALRSIGSPGDGPGEFNAPGGVAIANNGDLYIADFYNHRIQHLNREGRFIEQWGNTGEVGIWAEQFNYPTDVALKNNVALAKDDNLYAADGYNDRVQVFNKGKFLKKWGGPFALNIFGPFNGWFATVTSVEVGPKGNVFVADFYNNRIQKFTSDGTFLTAFGEEGDGEGQFNHAIAAAVTEEGIVFVVDFANNRIQKWRQDRLN